MPLIACRECGQRISDKAQSCPQCGAPTRPKKSSNVGVGCGTVLFIIIALAFVGNLFSPNKPSNTNSATSSAGSTETTSSGEPSPTIQRWEKDLVITKQEWSKSEFGIATWRIRIRNKSSTTGFKDIHFKTVYAGPSGTIIDRSIIGHTEYRIIPAGKSISVTFTEFVHSQAARASISIDDAKIAD